MRAAGPLHRRPRVRVEPVDLVAAGGRRVVVAADADRADLGQPGDDPVRIRPVADDVAEVPDRVDAAERREHRIERDEVGMDVRQDGDAHRQSLAARSAGIGAGPRAARRLAAPPGADASPGPAGPGGRLARVRRAGRAALRRDDEAVVGPAGRHAADDPDPAAAEARRPPAAPASSSSSSRSLLPGDERSAPGEQRERQLDELRQRRDRPGDDRRPALALTRVGGEVLGADRRDVDRRREAGRGDGRLEERRLLARSTRRAAPAPQATRPRAGCRGSRRRCRCRRTPGPRAGEAREPRRGCRRRAAGRARAGRGSAVRLIAAFQARSSRTWPSIAARAPGVSASPIAARPSSRTAANSGGSSGRP